MTKCGRSATRASPVVTNGAGPFTLAVVPTATLAVVLTASLFVACGRASQPPAEELTVWRPLGTWSGSGLLQTDPFISNTGQLRVTWDARDRAPSQTGTLRISLHSDVSGRLLAVVVDHRGAGRDVTYVTEDPRSFFLVIESETLDWSVEAAEGIPATRQLRKGPGKE